jgi:tungstate transport system substrate-binding protein
MRLRIALMLAVSLLLFGCVGAKQSLKLATTTSTYDSGLLDYLLPEFEKQYGVEVKVIAVGTGQALEMAKRGDVDAVLVHSPKDERAFESGGYSEGRHCVMYNDFVIAGPQGDPAGIRGANATVALQRIAKSGAAFVSRGDDSGTNKKEIELWKRANVTPAGRWYMDAGAGMADALRIASERNAYILSDRATLASMPALSLAALSEGGSELLNPYGVMAVNATRFGTNGALAGAFVEFMMSEKGQALIGKYEMGGMQLFHPLGGKCID